MGDAAFGMTGLDFETAVRCRIPIMTIVLNNSTMAIEIPHMKLSHEKHKARDLGGNYAAMARELGGWSERVEDPGEIGNAFLRARQQTEKAAPACWNSSPARRRRSPTANSAGSCGAHAAHTSRLGAGLPASTASMPSSRIWPILMRALSVELPWCGCRNTFGRPR